LHESAAEEAGKMPSELVLEAGPSARRFGLDETLDDGAMLE
jgi:hypothetical protein